MNAGDHVQSAQMGGSGVGSEETGGAAPVPSESSGTEGRGQRGGKKAKKEGETPIGLRPDQVAVHERMIHCRGLLRDCGIDTDPRTTKHRFAIVEFTAPPVPRENERTIELHPEEIESLPKDTYWVDTSEGEGNERYFTTFQTAVVEEAMLEPGSLRITGIRTPLSACFTPIPGKEYTCVAIVEERGKGNKAFRVERVMPLFPGDLSPEELRQPEPVTREVAFMPGIRRDRRDERIIRVSPVSVDPETGKNIYLGDGYLGYMKQWGVPVRVVLHETSSRFVALPAAYYEEHPDQAAADARELVRQQKPEKLEPGTFYCHGTTHSIVATLEAAVRDGLPTREERKLYLKRDPDDEEERHPLLGLSTSQIKNLRKKLLERFGVDKLQGALAAAGRQVDDAELLRRTARVQLIKEALSQLAKDHEANADF